MMMERKQQTTTNHHLNRLKVLHTGSTDNRRPTTQWTIKRRCNLQYLISHLIPNKQFLHSVKTGFQHEQIRTILMVNGVWKEEQCSSKFPMHQINLVSHVRRSFNLELFQNQIMSPEFRLRLKFEIQIWKMEPFCSTAHFFSKVL